MYKSPFHEHGTTYTAIRKQEYERSALRQDAKVLAYFKEHPRHFFTAEDIHRIVLPDAPLTSARRSLSNLTRAGYLVKQTNNKAEGSYGRDICTWRLSIKTEQLKMFQ